MNYQFNWPAFWDSFPVIIVGLPTTLSVAVVVFVLSIPLAVAIALARLSGIGLLARASYVYTETFRTVPLLVLLTWFFFVPGVTFGIRMNPFLVSLATFSLIVSAFAAEVFRGAIQSLEGGQRDAALATGMTPAQAYRRVILPQATMRALPLLATIWISLFRDTALVAIVGVHDIMFKARILAVTNYRPIEVMTMAAVVYFVLTYPQSLIVERFIRPAGETR